MENACVVRYKLIFVKGKDDDVKERDTNVGCKRQKMEVKSN